MTTPRSIIVDDSNTFLDYWGNWTTTNGTEYLTYDLYDMIFNGTLHKAEGERSGLWYTFTGTSGKIYGSVLATDFYPVSYQCLLDGVFFSSDQCNPNVNNQLLCEFDDLPEGYHNMSLVIEPISQPFLFDYIIYTPVQSTSIDDTPLSIIYQHNDTSIIYPDPSKWSTFNSMAHFLNYSSGSSPVLDLRFYGNKVAWYSVELPCGPRKSLEVKWSLDGSPHRSVMIEGQTGNITKYSQLLFETPIVQQAWHSLQVFSNPSLDTMPLSLQYIVVEGSNLVPPPVASIGPALPVGQGKGSTGLKKSVIYQIVMGALVGALVAIFIVLIVVFIRHRMRRRHLSQPSSSFKALHKSGKSRGGRGPYSQLEDASSSSSDFTRSSQTESTLESLSTTIPPYRLNDPVLSQLPPASLALGSVPMRSFSTSTRENSLFPSSRLSALPEKSDSMSLASSSSVGSSSSAPNNLRPHNHQNHRPSNNTLFHHHSHANNRNSISTSSTVTLLQSDSNIPPSKLPPPVQLQDPFASAEDYRHDYDREQRQSAHDVDRSRTPTQERQHQYSQQIHLQEPYMARTHLTGDTLPGYTPG